jgi:Fe-S-cluster containining protein
MVHVLLHKPNGDCMYLGTNGCTIYDRAPAVCKSFDCRAMYRMMNKRQRREAMKDSVLRDRIIAGRERQ